MNCLISISLFFLVLFHLNSSSNHQVTTKFLDFHKQYSGYESEFSAVGGTSSSSEQQQISVNFTPCFNSQYPISIQNVLISQLPVQLNQQNTFKLIGTANQLIQMANLEMNITYFINKTQQTAYFSVTPLSNTWNPGDPFSLVFQFKIPENGFQQPNFTNIGSYNFILNYLNVDNQVKVCTNVTSLKINISNNNNSSSPVNSSSTVNNTNNSTNNGNKTIADTVTNTTSINTTTPSTKTTNSTTNSTTNQTTNSTSNSTTNQTTNQTTNSSSNSTTNATTNSTTNLTTNSKTNSTTNSTTNSSSQTQGSSSTNQTNTTTSIPHFNQNNTDITNSSKPSNSTQNITNSTNKNNNNSIKKKMIRLAQQIIFMI